MYLSYAELNASRSLVVEPLSGSRESYQSAVLDRKDSAGSSRRAALPSKPVARNLVTIDCSLCKADFSAFSSDPSK